VKKRLKKGHWSAALHSDGGERITLSVLTSAQCIVGKWKIEITTSRKQETGDKKLIMSYTHPDHIYILFNPWCRGTHNRNNKSAVRYMYYNIIMLELGMRQFNIRYFL
jgi:transglutaminase 1